VLSRRALLLCSYTWLSHGALLGIVWSACQHFNIYTIVDMHQHENFGHYRSLFTELKAQGHQVSRMHVDIGCKVGPHLDACGHGKYHSGKLEASGHWDCCQGLKEAPGCERTQFVVPLMHMLCHCESCQLEFGVLYQEGHHRDMFTVVCQPFQVLLVKAERTWSF
jgi:hypothetical protein